MRRSEQVGATVARGGEHCHAITNRLGDDREVVGAEEREVTVDDQPVTPVVVGHLCAGGGRSSEAGAWVGNHCSTPSTRPCCNPLICGDHRKLQPRIEARGGHDGGRLLSEGRPRLGWQVEALLGVVERLEG